MGKHKWYHLSVRIIDDENVISMLEKHNFTNLDLSDTYVTDNGVSKLVNIHTLNLKGIKVTDMSISKLKNV